MKPKLKIIICNEQAEVLITFWLTPTSKQDWLIAGAGQSAGWAEIRFSNEVEDTLAGKYEFSENEPGEEEK